jgi:Protein of unknown function (DUF3592)
MPRKVWIMSRLFPQKIHLDIALSLLTVLCGLGLTIYGVRLFAKSHRAKTWPTAQGRIIESEVREVRDADGLTYKASILYEYSVNGVTHRSDVWRSAAGSSSSTRFAARAVGRYPVGAVVTVYCNPEKPTDAMLEPGKASWHLLLAGIAFFAAGIHALVYTLKR